LLAGTTIAVAYDEPATVSAAGVASVVELGDMHEKTAAATMIRSEYFIAKLALPSNETELSHCSQRRALLSLHRS
jgi:hypothetical protein